MHEQLPSLNCCDRSDAGNQRLVYGYREMSFQATYFKFFDMSDSGM